MGIPLERELPSAREVLAAQGFPEGFLDESIDVLSACGTLEDLRMQFIRRSYGCDADQFLLPLFRPLYQTLPHVRGETQEALAGLGASPELIDKYLTEFDDQPYLILGAEYGDQFTDGSIRAFVDMTRGVMFSALRLQLLPQE